MVNLVNEHLDFNRSYKEDLLRIFDNAKKLISEKNILSGEECEIYD